jgi:hypothetical protein
MSYSNVYHSYLLDGTYAQELADIYSFKDDVQEKAATALRRDNCSEALNLIELLYARFLNYYQTSDIQHARLADDLLEIAEQLTILDPSRAHFLKEFYGWNKSLFPQSRELEERRARRISLIRKGKIDRRILNSAGRYQEIAGIEEQLKSFLLGEGGPPAAPLVAPPLQRPQPCEKNPSARKGEEPFSLERWLTENDVKYEDFISRKEKPSLTLEKQVNFEDADKPCALDHQPPATPRLVTVQPPVPRGTLLVEQVGTLQRESLFDRAGLWMKRSFLLLKAIFTRKIVIRGEPVSIPRSFLLFLVHNFIKEGKK